ncbi:molecular chaperone [Burkholderia diffusa]|uniref:fimbrial biogenesis chaperone n=1 Tax=Burkholderia diffusa TaxID=488732 RepID=UPI000841F943|nr:fimbria/pilus periplasmic chaperone [Burkholderia diffusa]AOI60890.1 pilus assembly protein [Burkholderia diffusa]
MKKRKLLSTLLVVVSTFLCANASAGVVLAGTRVIFSGAEREVTVKVANEGKVPALVQAWFDTGNFNESPDLIDVPFTLTPSMFRLEPGRGQMLRIIRDGDTLPSDKESLFWLNVLEIPPSASRADGRNKLQVAFRTRVKMMYRPDGLPGSASSAPSELQWSFARKGTGGYTLSAVNPTPYVVNLGYVMLKSGGNEYEAKPGYVLPRSTSAFDVEKAIAQPADNVTVKFGAIDDWGGTRTYELPVHRSGKAE